MKLLDAFMGPTAHWAVKGAEIPALLIDSTDKIPCRCGKVLSTDQHVSTKVRTRHVWSHMPPSKAVLMYKSLSHKGADVCEECLGWPS